jgi:serine kinase of HPr protein (carbohydrate metabolism regulator)
MESQNFENLTFRVHNAILYFSTNSRDLMKEIRNDFGIFEVHNVARFDGKMKISLTYDEFPLEIPKYAIREAVLQAEPDTAIYSISEMKFLEEKKKFLLRVESEKNQVIGYTNSPSRISSLLRFLLKWMLIKSLEKKGMAFIHGSGVEKNGASLFFVGPSGFGKTHILITLLRENYRLITDDTILFKNGKVLPFHIRSKILTDMLNKFPFLKEKIESSNQIGRSQLIDLGKFFAVQKKNISPSKLFYVYVWNAPETKIEILPKKEMLSRLLHIYQVEMKTSPVSNANNEEIMKNVLDEYYKFTEKSDCYKIYAGNDLSKFKDSIKVI